MFYVVRGLSPYTEYEFHVIGVNNIGRGPASAPVSTTTGETGSKLELKLGLHFLNISLRYIFPTITQWTTTSCKSFQNESLR